MSLLKSKKLWIATILIGMLAAFGVYSYMYKPHAQIEEQKITFDGSASELKSKASSSETTLSNAIVALEGTVTSKADDGFTVDGSVFCQPKDLSMLSKITLDKSIKIKGRFIGYDDLLEEVKLDQVILK